MEKCNICESDRLRVLYALESLSIIKCQDCGLISISPIPGEEEIKQFYGGEEYFTKYVPRSFKDCTVGYSPNNPVIENYENILCTIENELGGRGKILDVGCARGVFLDIAGKRGWETSGVEISEYASAYARDNFGLKVFTGELRDTNLPNNYFDVVTVVDVLEHLNNPMDFLKEVNKILRCGGILYVHTVHSGSLFYYLADAVFKMSLHRIQWPLLRLYNIQHIYHFSPDNLKMMLRKSGFEVKRVSLQELLIDRVSRIDKGTRMLLEFISFLENRLSMGVNMVAVAKKME